MSYTYIKICFRAASKGSRRAGVRLSLDLTPRPHNAKTGGRSSGGRQLGEGRRQHISWWRWRGWGGGGFFGIFITITIYGLLQIRRTHRKKMKCRRSSRWKIWKKHLGESEALDSNLDISTEFISDWRLFDGLELGYITVIRFRVRSEGVHKISRNTMFGEYASSSKLHRVGTLTPKHLSRPYFKWVCKHGSLPSTKRRHRSAPPLKFCVPRKFVDTFLVRSNYDTDNIFILWIIASTGKAGSCPSLICKCLSVCYS